jgi:4-amino-4-deoxy-L-arabinose transferase-like glycosyltransferase
MKVRQKYLPIFWVLFGILLVWIHRFSSLQNPYFWDELGVYGNGVQHLYNHGISILASAMPPEISRGHPLLFYAFHALILKIFGNSFAVSHTFGLILSSACLWATYLLAKEFVSKLMAALAVCLLASLNIFLAQSTLILPEMMVALLSTLALLSYFKKKYIWVAVFLAVGVLIKESMIITAGFLGIVYAWDLIRTKSLKENIGTLFLFTIPLLVLLLFLLSQKIQNGWYFFPYHTDIVKEGALSGFFERLELHYNFIFYEQGRNQWLIFALIACLSIILTSSKRKVILLCCYFVYSLAFFSFAFYMDRYLLFLYPVLVVLVAQGLSFAFKRIPSLAAIAMSLFIASSIISLDDSKFRYDASLAYEDVLFVHREAVFSLCKAEETEICCWANFPINMSLWESSFGYIDVNCQNKIRFAKNPNEANYVLLYDEDFKNESFSLLQSFDKNEAVIRLYKKTM